MKDLPRSWTGGMILFLLLLCLTTVAYGAPAVLRDSVLTIDEGVIISGEEGHYFGNIRLLAVPDDGFQVLDAEPRNLAWIEEVSVAVVQPAALIHAELLISGYKSIECVELEPVAVTHQGNQFHVLVAETPPDPAATCIQGLAPFEINVPLDVAGLPAGDYQILVNGHAASFRLS